MTRRIEHAAQFKRDLDIAWNTIAERDVDTADRMRDRIFLLLGKLAETPASGHRRGDLPDDLMASNLSPWVLVFAYDDQRLVAVRLVHGARDFRRLF